MPGTMLIMLLTLVGCGDGESCEYKGEILEHSESITSEDGCSFCTCEDGLVTCVDIDCDDTEVDSGFWYR